MVKFEIGGVKKIKMHNNKPLPKLHSPNPINEARLFEQISKIIEKRKYSAGMYANREVTLMYWEIGNHIRSTILDGERAEYGKKIVVTLSQQLVIKYGQSFDIDNIRRMIRFAEKFDNFKIVAELAPQLSWSHFIELLREDENEPIGIILCTKASRKQIELMELDESGIAVAEYWTNLSPKSEFERKIKEILIEAQERIERRKLLPIDKTQKQIDYFYDSKDDDSEDN